MFEDSDPRHELWDTEEEEEEEEELEEGGGGSDSWAESEAGTQDCGRWFQDPSPHLPLQRRLWESQSCWHQRHLTPYGSQGSCQDQSDSGPMNGKIGPWGGHAPPWGQPPSHWAYDINAVRTRKWPSEQAPLGASRTLAHPSFQWFYTAVSSCTDSCPPSPGGHVPSLEPEPKAGPLTLFDCSSVFYTDPAMPPGHRIYNWLSSSSEKVLRHLQLNPPAPIMSVREAPTRQGLSEKECEAVSALLGLGEDVATLEGKEAPDRLP